MRSKTLSIFCMFATSFAVNSYAACVSPSGKTYSGGTHDVLYYQNTAKTSMSEIWGRRYAMRWTFNASGSTLTITGYVINAGDGGSDVLVNTTNSTSKATWTFNSATCSGTVTVAPRTGANATNTSYVFYQVSSSGTIISTINKNTPSASFTQTTGSTTTLVGGGTLYLE
jgi:hypothetical protein